MNFVHFSAIHSTAMGKFLEFDLEKGYKHDSPKMVTDFLKKKWIMEKKDCSSICK